MVGESFLGQDYLNAAVDFGTSLGGGVLSTLSNTASAAADTAAQGSGYLTSLASGQLEEKNSVDSKDIKSTKENVQTTSPASRYSSSLLNFNNLTNGTISTFKSPDILKSLTDAGTNTLDKATFGTSSVIAPTVQNLANLGSQTSNIVSSGLIAPTIMNSSSKVSSIPGIINNAVDNTDNNSVIINPYLPVITDASKIITPYTSSAMESMAIASEPLKGGTNFMVFDKDGNILSYAGSGAEQLFGDITNIIDTKDKSEKEKSSKSDEKSIDMVDDAMSTADKAADIAKSVLWDAPYTLGGNTGSKVVNAGKVTRQQLEQVLESVPDMTVAKIKMPDGNTLMRWKPQEIPEQSKSYPKEKELSVFDKGESYITESIPDNLKYQQTYKVNKGVSTDENVSDTSTYIPGVSNMLIKGLRYSETPKEGESEADKVIRTGGDTFDPTIKNNSPSLQSEKLNSMASKYVYSQSNGNNVNGYGYGNLNSLKEKEKKKNVYRKKAISIPKIILVSALRKQIDNITSRVNNKGMIGKRKRVIKNAPKKKQEVPFIQRQPEVKFKITTAMKGVANISDNIESIISLNGKSSDKIVTNPQFNFNLDNMLFKPKQNIKRGKKLINIKI
jgi:hypothetical protein